MSVAEVICPAEAAQIDARALGQMQNGWDFAADDWYLYEYAPKRDSHVRKIHIHFTDTAGQLVKQLFKQYAAWKLGRVRPVTVRLELGERLCHWSRYLIIRRMTEPERFDMGEFGRFFMWLRALDLSEHACDRILHTVSELIRTGQRLGWNVSQDRFPTDINQWKLQVALLSGQLTEENMEVEHSGTCYTKPIPPDIYEQIIRHAREDETDEITRSGILIQSQTGLRISEVLSLRSDCLYQDRSGRWWLSYRMKKTQRAEPVTAYVPANELVCEAVHRLRAATQELRSESGRKELFLIKNHGIRPVSQTNWNRGRLRSFLRRWDITDADGKAYELHSHRFRATYVKRQMLSGGSIAEIQRRFGHASPEMTVQYVHLSDEELRIFLQEQTCLGDR